MPDSTIDSVAPGGVVNLSDAPAGLDDATFDSLFPAEPTPVAIAPKPEPTPAPTPTPSAEPPKPQASEPFLKGQKSVYNSPEAAVEGLNQKDALIDQLRSQYAIATGRDPITGQPIAPVVQQPQPTDYYQTSEAYIKDASTAKLPKPSAMFRRSSCSTL